MRDIPLALALVFFGTASLGNAQTHDIPQDHSVAMTPELMARRSTAGTPVSEHETRVENFGNQKLTLQYLVDAGGIQIWIPLALGPGDAADIPVPLISLRINFHDGREAQNWELKPGYIYYLIWSDDHSRWEVNEALGG